MTEDKGYVYILTNPSFREDWVKIGKSSRPVDVRSKELDNTAVPLPFEIYATLKTSKYGKVEKQIHKQIDRLTDLRIRQNREFFNIAPDVALDIMRDIADLLDDAELAVYVDGVPVVSKSKEEDKVIQEQQEEKKRKKARPAFKFSMVNLKVGDKILFDDGGIEVTVAGDNKVEYEDRLWSLSAFTCEFLSEEKRNHSNAYQGPKYFSYKGRNLWELRKEMERCVDDCYDNIATSEIDETDNILVNEALHDITPQSQIKKVITIKGVKYYDLDLPSGNLWSEPLLCKNGEYLLLPYGEAIKRNIPARSDYYELKKYCNYVDMRFVGQNGVEYNFLRDVNYWLNDGIITDINDYRAIRFSEGQWNLKSSIFKNDRQHVILILKKKDIK